MARIAERHPGLGVRGLHVQQTPDGWEACEVRTAATVAPR